MFGRPLHSEFPLHTSAPSSEPRTWRWTRGRVGWRRVNPRPAPWPLWTRPHEWSGQPMAPPGAGLLARRPTGTVGAQRAWHTNTSYRKHSLCVGMRDVNGRLEKQRGLCLPRLWGARGHQRLSRLTSTELMTDGRIWGTSSLSLWGFIWGWGREPNLK